MRRLFFLLMPMILACAGTHEITKRSQQIANDVIIVDTHIDVPYRLKEKWEDVTSRTLEGEFDYVRAKEGGLDAAFMSIFIPASTDEKGGAKALADSLIDMVESIARQAPDKFSMAVSPGDILQHQRQNKISLCMGMENGAPIEGKFKNLRHFYDRGIRYVTLTHSKDNHISDSSFDTARTWKGLSPFGQSLIAEMNRIGMMIDVSHISDSAFYQVMRLTRTPVIASHSSCRFFTPGFERNMSDDMIRLLAQNGGVIMINFASPFITDQANRYREAEKKAREEFLKTFHFEHDDSAGAAFSKKYREEHPYPYADVKDVASHIDHVVKLVGIDYVGLGSDFDGVGDSLPVGLKDVSQYPNLIAELLKMGYSQNDIEKICSGNFLRVWSQIEQVAKTLQDAD